MVRVITALCMVSVHYRPERRTSGQPPRRLPWLGACPLSADCFAIACRAMDGYSGFNGLFGQDKADEMACMAHVRRKFVDVFASQGNAIAEDAIRRIAELYAVEKDARGKSSEVRVALRQARAKPIFNNLEAWLHAQLPKISGKSPLAQAIRYALGRMPKAGAIP